MSDSCRVYGNKCAFYFTRYHISILCSLLTTNASETVGDVHADHYSRLQTLPPDSQASAEESNPCTTTRIWIKERDDAPWTDPTVPHDVTNVLLALSSASSA